MAANAGAKAKRRLRGRLACAVIGVVAIATGAPSLAQDTVTYSDHPDDARWLRFDGGTSGGPNGVPGLDLAGYEYGAWQPNNPADTLFRGQWLNGAPYVRVDLTFEGLVHPPGVDFNTLFLFGDNPLLGFMEFDVDADADSGGELAGAVFRYNGNVARFGGIPDGPRFAGRLARDVCPGSFDADVSTGPYYPERSGEEFHLAFLYSQITALNVGTNGDLSFDPGETWIVSGRFFHRAHGFDDYVLLCCSNGLPSYDPVVDLLWQHSLDDDRTTVTLVYPLTNAAAAAVVPGDPAEPLDCCADNQYSIEEGLDHLSASALFASATDRGQPNFALLAPWELKLASDYLDPAAWQASVITVGAFIDTTGPTTVLGWTDVAPDIIRGDLNGDGVVSAADINQFNAFFAAADGGICDADGEANNAVELANFGNNYNIHDRNYDGIVNLADRPTLSAGAPFDADKDGDVDLVDYAIFQRCFLAGTGSVNGTICEPFDSNADGEVDGSDLPEFTGALEGPTATPAPVQIPGG